MSTDTGQPERPAWLKQISGYDQIQIDDRDAASFVLPDLDYEAQLFAIRSLLAQHEQAEGAHQEEIKGIEEFAERTSGHRNEAAVNAWLDRLHESVYQDAAHSMAAVGMIAPLVESIFYQAFQGIRDHLSAAPATESGRPRWQLRSKDQWDCHFVWKNGKRRRDLVQGIVQLGDATRLSLHMPPGLSEMLEALFAYRNMMFHCGFEWPIRERIAFQERISSSKWPERWFSRATNDEKPWIFYLTRDFTNDCLKMIDEVIVGIGAFCNAKLFPRPRQVHAGDESDTSNSNSDDSSIESPATQD